jgi:polyphosphate kinase
MQADEPLFINRELSWLEFNRRVLEEAQDPSVPALERLKFLAITASNLDEFFMIRVGGLQQLKKVGKETADESGLPVEDQLAGISRRTHRFVADQYECLMKNILEPLGAAGIRIFNMDQLSAEQARHVEYLFSREIYPVLTPMAIAVPDDFPLLPGLGVNLCVRLAPAGGGDERPRFAIVALPRTFPRFMVLPGGDPAHYILLDDVVRGFIDRLFPGNAVAECVVFRITRNADLGVSEDLAGDLLAQMREVLQERKESDCVRLEIGQGVSMPMMAFFRDALQVADRDIYESPGPVGLASFFKLAAVPGFEALKSKSWPPQVMPELDHAGSIFDVLARKDVLICHPYESFDPLVRFIEEAADDPDVLAVKQILYRTSENSPVVAALAHAAERGKQVTAVVELKARFDEARNIEWARALERAGVHLIYGVKDLKIHAKICLVVRREASGIRRYVHFGTGNYNEVTARVYTDVSYLTSHEDYGADASAFFNVVTGYSTPVNWRKIDMAPLTLRLKLIDLIENETRRSQQGQKSHIMAKLNSLVDVQIIKALYAASRAGVKIQLNVRGICSLRPGVPGLSENIAVVSIVDRFLEHSRIFYFHHGGDPLVFISSADWMPRNLDRRIELLVPVEDPACRDRLVHILEVCLQDNVKARSLKPDGTYERLRTKGRKNNIRAQEFFYNESVALAALDEDKRPRTFEPIRPVTSEP